MTQAKNWKRGAALFTFKCFCSLLCARSLWGDFELISHRKSLKIIKTFRQLLVDMSIGTLRNETDIFELCIMSTLQVFKLPRNFENFNHFLQWQFVLQCLEVSQAVHCNELVEFRQQNGSLDYAMHSITRTSKTPADNYLRWPSNHSWNF